MQHQQIKIPPNRENHEVIHLQILKINIKTISPIINGKKLQQLHAYTFSKS